MMEEAANLLPEVAVLGAMAVPDGQLVQVEQKNCDLPCLPFEAVMLRALHQPRLEVDASPVRAGQQILDEDGEPAANSQPGSAEMGLHAAYLLGSAEGLSPDLEAAPASTAGGNSRAAMEMTADAPTIVAGGEHRTLPATWTDSSMAVAVRPEASPLAGVAQAPSSLGDVEAALVSSGRPAAPPSPGVFDAPAQLGTVNPGEVSDEPAPVVGSEEIGSPDIQSKPGELVARPQVSTGVATESRQGSERAPASRQEQVPLAGSGEIAKPDIQGKSGEPAAVGVEGALRDILHTPGSSPAVPAIGRPPRGSHPAGGTPYLEFPAVAERPRESAGELPATVYPPNIEQVGPPVPVKPSVDQYIPLLDGHTGNRTSSDRSERATNKASRLSRTPQTVDVRSGRAVAPMADAFSDVKASVPNMPVTQVASAAGLGYELEMLAAGGSGPNQEDPASRPGERSLRWAPVEVRVPGYEAVDAVAGSNAHLPPESVIRSNIVHQIVRAAKLRVFESGADMTLRLDPPHLGTIQMSVTADQGVVTANLRASTELTGQVLEADLSALRQALAAAGIEVDAIAVSVSDDLNKGWNWHAGAQNGSPHPGNQGEEYYPRRLLEIENDAALSDEVRSQSASQFDHLA